MIKKLGNLAKIMIMGTLLAFCTACGIRDAEVPSGKEILTLATFDDGRYIRELVDEYNQENANFLIEVKQYERSNELEKDGILLLQREIASGNGPDIIDFGHGYTTSDIVGGYTENILEYMDESEQKQYLENVLNAFCYDEKLYAVPLGFTLKSFAGLSKNLNGYQSWNIDEMMDCYNGQDRMLYPGEFKKDVLATILTGSMEYYIDWETGQCNYDAEEFRKVLHFCNQFPDHLEITEDFSVKQTFIDDKSLLLPVDMDSVIDICRVQYIFDNEEVTFIGFPVEGDNGTMLQSCGPALAISSGSRHKEEAWKFISECLSESGQRRLPSGFPIRYSVLEEQIKQAMEISYEYDENGEKIPVVKGQVIFDGDEPIDIYNITPDQAKQMLDLIQKAKQVSSVEPKIYNIFMEEVEYYFNGAKSLEETVNVIQSRISMYIKEKI